MQKSISYKKKRFLENRLDDFIGKPKELWKVLKSLGLFSKTSVCGTTALKVKNTTIFETKSTLNVFKNYYSTLADNLLKKLPTPFNRYTINSRDNFFSRVSSKPISKLCNLSIKLGSYPGSCKIENLKSLFKKGPKQTLQITGQYRYYL